jgi:hypothetical protein
MIDGEKLRRFGLDKVALLLLLLAGLFFAMLTISSRTNFKLSKPVVLQGSGLAVSVPTGGGFKQLSEGFQYDDNEFRLGCVMQISSNAAASVHWRYFLLPFKKTASERFEIQASDIGGTIKKTGSEKLGQFTFDYAEIISEKTATLLFSGTTQLPDGRTLTLEVAQKGQNIGFTEKIFDSLAASVTFTPDNPLAKGNELLNNFRQYALADIVQKKTEQNYYYIKNYTGQSLGFIADATGFKADSPDANSLVAANLYFIKLGINSIAEQSLFRSEPNLQSFKWASWQSDLLINRNLTTSIELDRYGAVSVQKRNTVQNFTFTSTMLPEILSDIFIESFLQSSFDSVMVDIILSNGRIQPVLITRAEPTSASSPSGVPRTVEPQKAAQPNTASTVKVVFFGAGPDYQTMYLDSDGKILTSEVHGRLSYKLERTQRDRIIADFPQWVDKIEQIEESILEKSKNRKRNGQ